MNISGCWSFSELLRKWKKLKKKSKMLFKLGQELNACFALQMEIRRKWAKFRALCQQTERKHRKHFNFAQVTLLLPLVLLLFAVSHYLPVRTRLVTFVEPFHRFYSELVRIIEYFRTLKQHKIFRPPLTSTPSRLSVNLKENQRVRISVQYPSKNLNKTLHGTYELQASGKH